MSADEYHRCPICGGVPEQYRKYKDQYGKIPLENFLKIKKIAEGESNCQSLAVYHEIVFNADRTMDIQISAECNVCMSRWLYNVTNVNGGKK